jgi:hypothetical protein
LDDETNQIADKERRVQPQDVIMVLTLPKEIDLFSAAQVYPNPPVKVKQIKVLIAGELMSLLEVDEVQFMKIFEKVS